MERHAGAVLLRKPDVTLPHRLARSALAVTGGVTSDADVHRWLDERNTAQRHDVWRIPFQEMSSWAFDPTTGNLGHQSGRFFTVEGLQVDTDYGPIPHWSQPIVNQPEIGILGIVVREIDGVLHCLMQAKSEPGNVNGVQISPTVQATKSNYTRVHQGKPVRYLELFRNAPRELMLADVLQSEQGSWFYRKRNRNMIVEISEDIELIDDFRWLTIGQLHELLKVDNLVNMDARTVLSCMPVGLAGTIEDAESELAATVALSSDYASGSLHVPVEVMSWITDRQARHIVDTSLIPLDRVRHWHRTEDEIAHELGVFFSIIAVEISTNSREVPSWTQPLVKPHGDGLVALLVKRVDGVLHALVNARIEPGYLDVVELAPTVQCTPRTYALLPPEARPPFLDLVLGRRPEQVLFSTELSEEGGRFHHARSRYEIVEVDPDYPDADLSDFRWLTLHQLGELLKHSHYVNVQARSLIACLRGLR